LTSKLESLNADSEEIKKVKELVAKIKVDSKLDKDVLKQFRELPLTKKMPAHYWKELLIRTVTTR